MEVLVHYQRQPCLALDGLSGTPDTISEDPASLVLAWALHVSEGLAL